MPRYALLMEYDGSGFCGWQRQKDQPSVQKLLEEAAALLNHGVVPTATASGRTDAGVHAEAAVADIELALDLPPQRVRDAINFRTQPHPVVVVAAARVAADWSARFDCLGRGYTYRILNRASRPALGASRFWHVKRRLDADAMHEAARGLLGPHDFTAYRATACQAKSPIRTLDRLDVMRLGDEIHILAEARSFLHHQVRNLVGTLAEVGQGRRPVAWPRQVLEGLDRAKAGQTAPPDGLAFRYARYEPEPDWT